MTVWHVYNDTAKYHWIGKINLDAIKTEELRQLIIEVNAKFGTEWQMIESDNVTFNKNDLTTL